MTVFKTIFALFCIAATISTGAQCPNGISFHSQSEIDQFPANYPNCTNINGNVWINGPNITNLGGLAQVTQISGNFLIYNNQILSNISGLANLTFVQGFMDIGVNPKLSSLNGLSNLTLSPTSSLRIYNNDILTGLDQLSQITQVYTLTVSDCPKLTDLDGLQNITSVTSLGIHHNNKLVNMSALSNLTNLGQFVIVGNPQVADLSDFHNLTTVTDLMVISESPNFTNLSGLTALNSVADMIIQYNPVMTTLTGMPALAQIENLHVQHNPAIQNLNGIGLVDSIQYVSIWDNATLPNLTGLENLVYLHDLGVYSNNSLNSLSGIPSINAVSSVEVSNNPILNSLGPLQNIQSITSSLWITGNTTLSSLSGTDLIDLTAATDLNISDNGPSLTFCAVQSVCDYLTAQKPAYIATNGNGCNSVPEVQVQCLTALPVQLTSFSGQPLNTDILLEWTTDEERDFAYFELEHSTNGVNFEKTAQKPGEKKHSYSCLHTQPGHGTHYYRLKMVSNDGSFQYSGIVAVKMNNMPITVFPNPSRGIMFIHDPEEMVTKVQIFNSQGMEVKSMTGDEHVINLTRHPKGTYQVNIQTDAGTSFYNIVVE